MNEEELLKWAQSWSKSANEERKPLADAILALFDKIAKSESLTAEAVAREAARWRGVMERAEQVIRLYGDPRQSQSAFHKHSAILADIKYLLDSTSPDWLSSHDAEVLRPWRETVELFLDCPLRFDEATIPANTGVNEAPPYQVIVNFSCAWTKVLNARELLATVVPEKKP